MPLVLLPDGRYLDVPDNISEEERTQLQERLAEVYPETESLQQEREEIQTNLGGHLEEVVKGIPRGLASTFLSAGEGITSLFSAGNDNAAVNWFKNIQTDLNESFLGVDEGYEDAFSSKLGAGLGSFASFFIPGAIYGKATGLSAKAMKIQESVRKGSMSSEVGEATLKKLLNRASASALPIAIPVGVAEQARNIEYARQMGEEVGIGQEIASELLGGAIGASEIYAIKGLLGNIVKGPAAYRALGLKYPNIRRALATGGREALQESLAGLAQDAVALGIYSDEIPIGESLFDDFTVGGAVGALSDLVFSGVMGRKGVGNAYLRKQAEEAQKEEDAKFKDYQELREQAIEQGAVVLPAQGIPESPDSLRERDKSIDEEIAELKMDLGRGNVFLDQQEAELEKGKIKRGRIAQEFDDGNITYEESQEAQIKAEARLEALNTFKRQLVGIINSRRGKGIEGEISQEELDKLLEAFTIEAEILADVRSGREIDQAERDRLGAEMTKQQEIYTSIVDELTTFFAPRTEKTIKYGMYSGASMTSMSDQELYASAQEVDEMLKALPTEKIRKVKGGFSRSIGGEIYKTRAMATKAKEEDIKILKEQLFNIKLELGDRKGPSEGDRPVAEAIPILETHLIQGTPEGTYSVVGATTGIPRGTFETDTEAREFALQSDKNLRNEWVNSSVKDSLLINGVYGNGTAFTLGQRVYSPLQNSFDAKVLANYDSRISKARKEQYRNAKTPFPSLYDAQKEEILQRGEFHKTANIMKDNMLRELLGPQVDAMTERQLQELRDQLDEVPNIFPIYKQSLDADGNPILGQFDPATEADMTRGIDATSQLGIFYDKVVKRGIQQKNFYTIAEAKKILKKQDFDQLMKEKADVTFKISEILNEYIGIRRNKKGEVDVAVSALKEVLDKKNIDTKINSEAFQYFAESVTGTKIYNNMSRGQKEMLLSRLATVPRFNSKQPFPDFRPRPYNSQQMSNFYTSHKGERVTLKQVKEEIKNKDTGENLNQKQALKFKDDLIESGRARKVGNRLEITQDFDLVQARKTNGLNETPDEYGERLSTTTQLLPEEINELVEQEQVTQAEVLRPDEILRLAPPENPEKYRILLKELRSRLDAMGLKDIALKFDNALRGSMGIKQDETGRLYFQQRDSLTQAEYDRPMKTILIALEKADPDMSMTVEEFKDSVSGLMDHEVMHALIDLGLLTQKEVDILKQESYRTLGNDRVKRMKRAYPELGPAAFEEEMMAELFRKFRVDPDSIGGKPKGIIQKIMNFLTTVIRTIGNGFRTPTAILTDISEGRIGARQRGQIRSLHKLDKAKEMANASLYTPTFAVDIPDVGSRGRMAKAFADKGITRVNTSDPDVGRAFNVVAEAQRGEPERQYQVFNQVAGTNMPMLVGDLVHVIAGDNNGSSLRTTERLTEKLFRKGIFEDFTRKYSETIPELNIVEGAYWSENEFTRNPETIAKGKKYADAYRNLSAYNEPQYHARELAVAYGDLDMDRAATHAQYFLDNREPFDDFWKKMRVAYKDKKGNLMQWEEVVKKMRPPPDKKHSYSQMDEAVKTLRVREKIENWYEENYKGVPLWKGIDPTIANEIPTVDAMKFIEKTAPDKSYKLIAKKVRIALGKLDKLADIKSTTTLITPELVQGFEAYVNRVNPDAFRSNDPKTMTAEDVIRFGNQGSVRRNQNIMSKTIKDFSDPTTITGLAWTGFDSNVKTAKYASGAVNKTHVFLNNISSTANGLTYRTFLHEGIHAATVPIIGMVEEVTETIKTEKEYERWRGEADTEIEWLEKAFPTSLQAVKRLENLRKKLRSHNIKKRRDVIKELDQKIRGVIREKGYRNMAEYAASPDVIDPREFLASRLNPYEAGGMAVNVDTLIGRVTMGGKESYTIADVSELVTYGLTDKGFQEYLESIPYRPRSKRSMWSEFVLAIRRLLGISPAVNNTAFSEILRISDDLMSVADQEILALSQYEHFDAQDLATLTLEKGKLPEGVTDYIEDRGYYPEDESPTFSRNEDLYTDRMLSQSGIVPENILFPGKVEEAVYRLWRDTDHRPSANDIKKLYDQLKGKGSTHKNDFVDYQQLMNDIEDGLVKGLDYLWYEKWGLNIPLIVGDANMNEFSKVFGITSSQSTPEQNLKSTLGVMIAAREVMRKNEIADFDATNIKKLENVLIAQQTKLFLNKGKRDNLLEMYRTGQMMKTGTGQKTATMALEITEAANNRFTPWAVLDRHMFTKFNLDPRIGSASKGGLNITAIEYRLMQSLVGLLSTEVYRDINGFPRQLTPPQVQALLWAHERYGKDSATNPASYDSAVKFADKEIKQLEEMEDRGTFNKDNPISGKFIFNPRFRSGAKKDLFDSNLATQMYQSIVELAPSIAFEFKMGVDRGYLPEGFNVSFEEHLDYLNNLLKELTVGNQLKFLRRLGIPHEITISAGTYGKELTPNIVLRLPGADPQTVEGIAGLVTDAFLQDSAVISRPEKGGVHTGLTVSKPDNAKFTQEELTGLLRRFEPLVRAKEDVNFTVLPSKGNSVMLIDPRSFAGEYTEENAAEFFGIIQQAIANTDYTLNTYGQDSGLIEYKKTPYTKGVSRSLRFLGDRAGLLGSSDLQRTILSDFYVPAFQHYKRFARRHGIEPNQTLPIHSKRSALYGQITEKGILGQTTATEWKATALAESERYPVGRVPPINDKASATAIAVAFQLREGTRTAKEIIADLGMEEKPTFARSASVLPSGYEQALEDIGGINQPDMSFGESIVDMFAMENISSWLQRLRTNVVNKYNHAEKATIKAGVNSPEARELLNHASTDPIRALLFADKAQAITAASIKYGVPIYDPIEGSSKVVDFEHGGLLEILMPLYADPEINKEALLFILAVSERGTKLDENGIETPVTQEVIDKAQEIKAQFPEVVSVYKKYQEWNNELIKYAVASGMLNADLAQTWIDASIYYPFYRKMQDGDLAGPNIAHGSITATNPLAMKIKGSKEALHPAPLETISRNANSIIQASMKNIGMEKLLKVFEASGMAERVKPGESTTGAYIVPVFINGNKEYYRVSDPEYIYGLQVVGLSDNTGIFRFLAMSAGFLREMVTRDPGFMLVNMMRDTMSAFVTSGADFKPFIDTFKNFTADISDLERYGVAGGYDFKDDQLDIANFMKKEMRKRGISENGGMNVTDAFIKVWDFAGEMTTNSDMSTRKGVYDVIYQQTGSQYEAAFQALEIINFARRGADPYVRIITAAIPFLNARIQGLDIIWRGGTGQYSAVRSQLEGSEAEIARQIQINMLTRGAFLMFLTAMYYAWVSDEDEYKNASLEQRDDHWILPGIEGLPPLKIPIPFEVGTIFKVIPERIMDVMMGGEVADLAKSYKRQLRNTLKIDPLGFQAIKPFVEVMNNRSTYTGSEIIPYYMQTLEPTEQSRYGTNEFARLVGTRLGISPIKLEYLMRGYGGTLGGYLLGMTDAMLRQATGRDFLTPRIDQMPVLKRFFGTEFGGGLQQQFYELRTESDRLIQTINKMKKENRWDELQAYVANRKGLVSTRSQVLALDRFMANWRRQRDRVLHSDLSTKVKKDIIEQMMLTRDARLMYVPELRKASDLPVRFVE